MKFTHIYLILFLQSSFVCAEDFTDYQKIESEASNYRMLAIECITDKKITKKETLKVESCIAFRSFASSIYPALKTNLEKAQEKIKLTAETEGLTSEKVRKSLILLMSARSHMKIAGEISAQI